MMQLTYPGVYTQELSSGVRSITGAATSVALFIGPTRSGIDARPTRVRSFAEFERSFGGLSQTSNLSYSVLHFFANGGGEAFIRRVPAEGSAAAVSAFKNAAGNAKAITVTALSSGLASNDLFVEFDPFDIGANPLPTGPLVEDNKRFNLTVTDRVTGRVERFGNLTTASNSARFAETVVNAVSGSQLVRLKVEAGQQAPSAPVPNGTVLKVGALAAGTFANETRIAVTIRWRDPSGAEADAIPKRQAVVYAANEAKPATGRNLATRLERAINKALSDYATANTGAPSYSVTAQAFENGRLIRLSVSPAMIAGDSGGAVRLSDATIVVENADAAGANANPTWSHLLSDMSLAAGSTKPSRYRLGTLYVTANANDNADVAQNTKVTAGADGATGQPATPVLQAAIEDLENQDPYFNILCLPDLVRPSVTDALAPHHSGLASLYESAARICKKTFAFLLVDPFPGVVDLGTAEDFKATKLGLASGTHAAAFFPNIRVDDPLDPGTIRAHPPSGAIAGIIARTDSQVGVWQAPAGTDATLAGVYGPSVVLSDDDQGVLNVLGLNCIRQFPIFGTVNFGSRTVDGSNALASEWKYIPVRRTASYILRSLSEGLRWAVHRPNGEQLWAELRLSATAFMHGLFRQGAFKGTASRDAYFVRCDATTTLQQDIDQGIVNLQIGFAPLKPAEFVVITLRQLVQAQN